MINKTVNSDIPSVNLIDFGFADKYINEDGTHIKDT